MRKKQESLYSYNLNKRDKPVLSKTKNYPELKSLKFFLKTLEDKVKSDPVQMGAKDIKSVHGNFYIDLLLI